jgi:hypothetical protein
MRSSDTITSSGFPRDAPTNGNKLLLFQAMDKPSCVPKRESEVILFYEFSKMNSPGYKSLD